MTDPKKRLEEILNKFEKAVQKEMVDDDFEKLIKQKNQTINKILKEFVYKDNLLSEFDKVTDICIYDFLKSYINSQIIAFQKGIDKIWSTLRKLIEGNKNV